MKKVFLTRSLGCRLNVAEMMKLEEELEKEGWETLRQAQGKGDKPDLVIINSCAVTHKADKETRQLIRKMRREYPEAKLVVTGCFVGYDELTEQVRKMGAIQPLKLAKNQKSKGYSPLAAMDKSQGKSPRENKIIWVLNKDKDKLVELVVGNEK